jgi:putative ABC transport system permease protein
MIISLQELLTSVEVGLIFGSVAIGIYLTFRTINFTDLTCDGSFVLGASISAILIKHGANPYLSLLVSFIFGGMAGLFTGILNIKFKITDLLSGIIVAFMLYSINLRIMGNSPNITFVDCPSVFSNNNIALLIILTMIPLCLIYLLSSGLGLKLRAIGYNKQFSLNSGINVKLMTIVGLMLSNAMISFGGGLFSQYQGFCDASQGTGTLVIGLASVVIGEKVLSFRKEPLLILSCILGSILYRIFIGIALHSDILGIRTQDLNLITGAIIILIMLTKGERKNA